MKKDEKWKSLISKYLKDFLAFFMLDLYKEIDFEKGYEFLDGELNRIKIKSKSKNRRSDKLVKVYLKDGTEKYILIHIEVQGYFDDEFSKRMFKYFYRISDLHDTYDITAISIFTDEDKSFKPSKFQKTLFGTEISYKYNTYKVLEQKEKNLKKSDNIFAFVVLTTLYSLKAKDNQKKKFDFKLELVKILSNKNYSKETIIEIFEFLDLLLSFKSKKLEILFDLEVDKMPSVKEKEIMGSYKKFLLNKAKKEINIEIIINGNKNGFSNNDLAKITKLSIKEIEEILKNAPSQEN
ncbi:MAG: hypothetical protein ACK4IX_12530 [Candidatus Sericytochromatia bacterium]